MDFETFETTIIIGMMTCMLLVYVVAGIIFLVISSKTKKKNPKDAKNWLWVSILMFGFAALGLIGMVFSLVVGNMEVVG